MRQRYDHNRWFCSWKFGSYGFLSYPDEIGWIAKVSIKCWLVWSTAGMVFVQVWRTYGRPLIDFLLLRYQAQFFCTCSGTLWIYVFYLFCSYLVEESESIRILNGCGIYVVNFAFWYLMFRCTMRVMSGNLYLSSHRRGLPDPLETNLKHSSRFFITRQKSRLFKSYLLSCTITVNIDTL